MGGAASAQAELQQMVACTFLLGQALSRAFPEIYTINDFHANKEKLKREIQREEEKRLVNAVPMVILRPDGTVTPVQFVDRQGNPVNPPNESSTESQRDEDDNGDWNEDVPLNECLILEYQGREVPIRLSSLGEQNESGWTILHACCHQQSTIAAAEKVIEAMMERGIDLDLKTTRGPGSYATGWTALHMASAYGLTPVVSALLAAGASVDTANSIGWKPLFEAVHRGYTEIARLLLKAMATPNEIIPASMIAPYHAQYPLAHACRQNHPEVVKALLDAGADVDAQNEGGWTALHEATYFRTEDCARALVEQGCDVLLKTRQGYTALHFESSPVIRQLLLSQLSSDEEREKYNRPGAPQPEAESKFADSRAGNEGDEGDQRPEYRLLGDLPGFKANSFMQTLPDPTDNQKDDEDNKEEAWKRIAERRRLRKENQGKLRTQAVAPPEQGVPEEFACHLSGKLLVDPVTTMYGHHFEKSALQAWIKSQGNLCPITGQPLSESEIVTDKDLRIEINDWQLKQALASENNPGHASDEMTKRKSTSSHPESPSYSSTSNDPARQQNSSKSDDMYEFD